jgi:NADH-quinone oxidoreductase subunit A
MTDFSLYLLVFLGIAVFFLFFHLMLGKIVRPARPDPEKLTIYECGEPTIGSSWIQFDLRFYVVALLFVIFDVEVVFFFPWAVVFGKANQLASQSLSEAQRVQLTEELVPAAQRSKLVAGSPGTVATENAIDVAGARSLAWLAFWDIAVFFGVLLVGFAYLWKRGDLDWVRSTAAEQAAEANESPMSLPTKETAALVGATAGERN